MTLLSLVVMVAILLLMNSATLRLLRVYDNLICVVFLADFAVNLKHARSRRNFFIGERGWLDLLGSIPTFGFLRFTALFRLARLSRLERLNRNKIKRKLINDVVSNRSQYAVFITLNLTMVVLMVSSALVLEAESHAAGANIKTGGDALWWAVVTITTVGYGDTYPVTWFGRMVAVFVMVTGVGIIASLASILTSIISPSQSEPSTPAVSAPKQVDALDLAICLGNDGSVQSC
jgi:voltage-gated potassium channel